MLKSFLFNVSGLTGSFTLADRESECIKYIKNTVGNKKVLVSNHSSSVFWYVNLDVDPLLLQQSLLSGGVDSTVCTVLLHKALSKDQVIAIHIDNGFMRKDESTKVVQALRNLNLDVNGAYQITSIIS